MVRNNLFTRDDQASEHTAFTVYLVFTTVQHTLLGLQAMDQLTKDFATHIYLLFPVETQPSAALIMPQMLADFTARYFLTMIPHSRNLTITLTAYPAASEDLWEVLPPQSLIVLVGRAHRFWLSAEQQWARQLRGVGHEVIFVSTQSLEKSCYAEAKNKTGRKDSGFQKWKRWFSL